jgi:hypothetical protein
MTDITTKTVAVVGLGYVGLPLALAFGRQLNTIGFDISEPKLKAYREGFNPTGEMAPEAFTAASRLSYTSNSKDLAAADYVVVAVPTPIDNAKQPGLYPRWSSAGYSPERINPGDKQHRVTDIKKVTSGSTPETADFVDALYASIITAGTHKAPASRSRKRPRSSRTPSATSTSPWSTNWPDLQQASASTPRRAGSRRHQVELPAVPPRPGRRPLHRRGSVLPDPQGPGSRLPPGGDPGRPPHQRRHGRHVARRC